jgi:hypothetical protein
LSKGITEQVVKDLIRPVKTGIQGKQEKTMSAWGGQRFGQFRKLKPKVKGHDFHQRPLGKEKKLTFFSPLINNTSRSFFSLNCHPK